MPMRPSSWDGAVGAGAVNGPQHLPHLHKRRDPNASSMQGGIFGGGDDFAW